MFRRRPRLVAFALLVLILSGAIGALIAMLKREPAFYAQAAPRRITTRARRRRAA